MVRTFFIISILFFSGPIFAQESCPAIDHVPDLYCDGQVTISILGDSLGVGFRDTRTGPFTGYVGRAMQALPNITFRNWSKAGEEAGILLRSLNREFRKEILHAREQDLIQSTYVVLDIGRNDRWRFGLPSGTYRNLKKIYSLINTQAMARIGRKPLVITAVLMLPNRGSQGPWVKELDKLILSNSTDTAPADLRFDLVSKRLLSFDQIHPTAQGYAALAKTFVFYLQRRLSPHVQAIKKANLPE